MISFQINNHTFAIIPCKCDCGGNYAWVLRQENESDVMIGCICHNLPQVPEDKKPVISSETFLPYKGILSRYGRKILKEGAKYNIKTPDSDFDYDDCSFITNFDEGDEPLYRKLMSSPYLDDLFEIQDEAYSIQGHLIAHYKSLHWAKDTDDIERSEMLRIFFDQLEIMKNLKNFRKRQEERRENDENI